MSLAQCQQLLLGRWLGLIGMSNGCAAAIFKTGFPLHLATPQPLVAALPRDLVDPAQLRHRPLPALIRLHKLPPLFHHSTRSPGHVVFYRPSLWERKVSTMRPVCSVNHAPGLYQTSAQPGRAGNQFRTSSERRRCGTPNVGSAAPPALHNLGDPSPSPSPAFLWNLVVLENFMPLFLLKGARAARPALRGRKFGFPAGL